MQQATQPAMAGMNAPALNPFTFMKKAGTNDFNFNQTWSFTPTVPRHHSPLGSKRRMQLGTVEATAAVSGYLVTP
jgi:hypothetical protein